MNTNYLASNSKELFEAASADIKNLIKGGEVNDAAKLLGEKYNLQIGLYQRLANIISYTLIGAIQPINVVVAITDGLALPEDEATNLAQDLEVGIFTRARNITLGKEEPVAVLKFDGPRSPDELRKEILDTTKRESALVIPQTSGIPKKTTSAAAPGSRSQLLEQLQILSAIPNDEEVEERLSKIQAQISTIKKKEDDNLLDSKIALKSFMFGTQGKETVEATLKTATYSVAPTHYNLDPYREVAED